MDRNHWTEAAAVLRANAFQDGDALEKELRVRGLSAVEAAEVRLMTRISGFSQLFSQGRCGLELFVRNGTRETGLRRDALLAFALAVQPDSGPTPPQWDSTAERDRKPDAASNRVVKAEQTSEAASDTAVPPGITGEDLSAFQRAFRQWRTDGTPLPAAMLDLLGPLGRAGVPEALYCQGSWMLQAGSEAPKARALLREAADAGVPEAAAELADDYYQHPGGGNWERAMALYTGYGALALTPPRREAVARMLDRRAFNRRYLAWNGGLLGTLTALLIPGGLLPLALFAPLGAGLLGGVSLWSRTRPYGEYGALPAGLFALWAACLAVRLLV